LRDLISAAKLSCHKAEMIRPNTGISISVVLRKQRSTMLLQKTLLHTAQEAFSNLLCAPLLIRSGYNFIGKAIKTTTELLRVKQKDP
jgi:hypothetical protein